MDHSGPKAATKSQRFILKNRQNKSSVNQLRLKEHYFMVCTQVFLLLTKNKTKSIKKYKY